VWLEEQLLFSTHPKTITAHNLKANPALAVHPESGDQVAIVEGTAAMLDDPRLLARFGEVYRAKYDWPLSRWGTATDIGETITRWSFDRPG
jgi:hypothetical protein